MNPSKPTESKSLNVHQRLLRVMEKVSYVQKENKKVNNQYTFTSIDSVKRAVRGPLLEAGVVVVPRVLNNAREGTLTTINMEVDFVNADDPGDKFTGPTFGYGLDPQDKGPGKAMSYALKYGLLQALMLETGDDPEKDVDHQPLDKVADYVQSQPKQTVAAPAVQKTAPLSARGVGITDPQLKRLFAITKANGYDPVEVDGYIANEFKLTSKRDLTRHQYDQVINLLEKKALPKIQAQSSNEPPPYSDAEIPF